MTITIGRVGLDNDINLANVESWRHGSSDQLSGRIVMDTLDDALHVRDELRSLSHYAKKKRLVIPITWSSSPTLDGFYHLLDAQAFTRKVTGRGVIDYAISAELVGRASDVQVRSLIQGTVLENDYTVGSADPSFWHAPAAGALAYDGGPSGTVSIQRDGALSDDVTDAGVITAYVDMTETHRPAWIINPGAYYSGGCRLLVDGYLRAGLLSPNTETGWELNNGIIRILPVDAGGGISNGRIEIQPHDGSGAWDTGNQFRIIRSATTIPRWHTFTILRNDPEVVSIRLVRDAATVPAGSDRHTLDITLFRGAPWASFIYRYSAGANTYTVGENAQETAHTTDMTPTGASGPVGIRRSTNDADGHRWWIASPSTTTADTANGELDWASTTLLKFAIGYEINSSSHGTGNGSEELLDQYFGYRSGLDEVVPL